MNNSNSARRAGRSRRGKRGFSGNQPRKRFAFSKQRRKTASLTPLQKIKAFFANLFKPSIKPDTTTKPARKSSGEQKTRKTFAQQPHPPAPRPKPARAPEHVEVTSPRLYVGNLSYDATESDLFDLFNGVGQVRNAEVVSHKNSQRSKGFAFVQMQTIEEAKRAVVELHDKEFMGRKLVVSGARLEVGRQAGS